MNLSRLDRDANHKRPTKPPRHYSTRPAGPSPRPSSRVISLAMRSNKSSGTRPELILSRLLRKKLTESDLPGRPEFVYPRARLAVFVHGCWWHGCPEHYVPPKTHGSYWKRKIERNMERDRFNREDLVSIGWRV